MADSKVAASSSSKKRAAKQAFEEPEEARETECVICLENPKVIGSLDCCEHTFCFECIESWGTTRENTCPLCKARFKVITKTDPQEAKGPGSSKGKGRRKRPQKIRVKDRDQATSLEPPGGHHQAFYFPPFIFFNPQNYMGMHPNGGDDSDDEEALATLENFLGDPLGAFARIASGGGMAENPFRHPPPPVHSRTIRAAPAPSSGNRLNRHMAPVDTLASLARRNTASTSSSGGGGAAWASSSSRASSAPRPNGVGSSAANPVVLLNDSSDDDSDEVQVVNVPSTIRAGSSSRLGDVFSSLLPEPLRIDNDFYSSHARIRGTDGGGRRGAAFASGSGSGGSVSASSSSNDGGAAASSSWTQRTRGGHRLAQGNALARASSSSAASSSSSSLFQFQPAPLGGAAPLAPPLPPHRLMPTVTIDDIPDVEPVMTAARRNARSAAIDDLLEWAVEDAGGWAVGGHDEDDSVKVYEDEDDDDDEWADDM